MDARQERKRSAGPSPFPNPIHPHAPDPPDEFHLSTELGGSFLVSGLYLLAFTLLDLMCRASEAVPGICIWYPASGLSLALLLVFRVRLAPAVFVAYLISGLGSFPGLGHPLAAVLLAAGACVLFTLMAAFFLSIRGVDARLGRLLDLIALALVSVCGAALLAGYKTLILCAFELWRWEDSPSNALALWMGDVIGLLTVTPFLLLLAIPAAKRRLGFPSSRPLLAVGQGQSVSKVETVAQVVFMLAALWLVFEWERHHSQGLGYLIFLPVAWASLRHGLPGTYSSVLTVHFAALLSSLFADEPGLDLLETQVLLMSLSLTGLFLGAVGAQRWQAVEQLRVEKAYLEKLFESAPEAIVVVDNQSRVMRANAEFTRLFGYSLDEAKGRRVDHLIVPEEFREEALSVTGKIMNEGSVNLETVRKRRDGTLINVSILGTPIEVDGGQVAVYGIYRDITGHRELEEQLRQSQKMEAIGRLAGGVAHDFNNLLTAILGYAELLAASSDSPDRLGHYIEEIRKAANRAKSLTSQLLAFSRKQVLTPKVISLCQIVSNIEPMLARLLGEDIQLTTDLASAAGKIKADPGQIEQVIVNLAVNARDAMPEGGRILVEVREAILSDEYSKAHSTLPGRYVRLVFSDNGVGMTSDVRRRIFEPFFTTKEQGKGTGLGLATVYGIVKQSGGHLEVESQPRIGTTFTIYFPQVLHESDEEVLREQPVKPEGSAETVMVVEDEDGIRGLISEILKRNRYRVIEAPGGARALLMSEAFGDTIHLLLTDVVMPEMSGRELARRLRAQRPFIKILFMSGYSDETVADASEAGHDAAFLQKPFTPEGLLKKVREVLE